MKHSQENIRFQKVVVFAGSFLLAVKFFAYVLTGSNAILSDALESVVNVVAGVFGLLSLVISALPRDANHPYGHGKIEFVSASVEGSLISLAGLAIIGKSVYNLLSPVEVSQLDLGIALTAFTGLVNYLIGWLAVRKGRKNNSLALLAGGKHLKSDAYSSAGIILGLMAVFITGFVWLDSLVAITFGIVICFTGYKILKASIAGIMDEADYELLEKIVDILNQHRRDNWLDIHNLRVIKYGALLHIDCHLTVPPGLTVREAHAEVEAISELISANTDQPVELFIHTDPAHPGWQANHPGAKAPWRLEQVLENKKHGLPPLA